MKTDFITCSLKNIASNVKGSIISGPFGSNIGSRFFQETGIPVIRGNNLSNGFEKFKDEGFAFVSEEKADELNAYAIRDDLLFTAAGTIGQVGLIEKKSKYNKYVISNKQMRVRLDLNKINVLYAYYWFSSPWIVKDIINKNTGSTVPLINLGIIKSLEIRIPRKRSAQDRIASVLSSLDSKIELNNKINAELEQTARLIYDYWFTQFDFPDANGKPYKSSGGAMTYSDQLKRDIPKGWRVESLFHNSITQIIKPKINYFDGERIYLATADVNDLSISNGSNVTYENRESRANMQPIANSVWFAKMQNSTKHIFVGGCSDDIIKDYIFSTGFMGLKTEPKAFEYIASFIHHPYFELVKNSNAHGATMSGIGNDDMKNIKLPVPDGETLLKLQEVIKPMYGQIDKNRQESAQLAKLRDWLLPMLMTGQVNVST
jgi:type I restriction enzyme S subunit